MISVFISYAHADEKLKEELLGHLAALRREGLIGVWHDRKLKPGEHLDSAIEAELAAADLVLLLISSHFISSDYCAEREMQRAFARDKQGQCKVAAIILRPCQWQKIPIDTGGDLGEFLAIPNDGKPVTLRSNRDAAWNEVVAALRTLITSDSPGTKSLTAKSGAMPLFELSFDPQRDIHRNANLYEADKLLDIKTNCVLVRALATGNVNVDDCTGWITSMERLDANKATIDRAADGSRQLRWSGLNTTTTTLRPGVPQQLNVFWCIENSSAPQLMSEFHLHHGMHFSLLLELIA